MPTPPPPDAGQSADAGRPAALCTAAGGKQLGPPTAAELKLVDDKEKAAPYVPAGTNHGNNFAPGYADHFLAKHGYEAQMIDEPEDPNRPNNLWEPLPGDAGAHGVFDDRAIPRSVELELNKNRSWIMAGAAAVALGILLAARYA